MFRFFATAQNSTLRGSFSTKTGRLWETVFRGREPGNKLQNHGSNLWATSVRDVGKGSAYKVRMSSSLGPQRFVRRVAPLLLRDGQAGWTCDTAVRCLRTPVLVKLLVFSSASMRLSFEVRIWPVPTTCFRRVRHSCGDSNGSCRGDTGYDVQRTEEKLRAGARSPVEGNTACQKCLLMSSKKEWFLTRESSRWPAWSQGVVKETATSLMNK